MRRRKSKDEERKERERERKETKKKWETSCISDRSHPFFFFIP
jgi:hypothetical protein